MATVGIALLVAILLGCSAALAQTTVSVPAAAGTSDNQAEQEFARGLALYRGTPDKPRDPAGSALAFRRAAEAGHAGAAEYLAIQYARGEGVPQDPEAALAWLDRALALLPEGSERAVLVANRGVIFARLTPEQRKRIAEGGPAAAGGPPAGGATIAASPPAAAAEQPAASPSRPSGWRTVPTPPEKTMHHVQLGAYRNEAAARRALADLTRRFADTLGSINLVVDRGRAKPPMYRLKSGAMTAAAADRTCATLNKSNVQCLVVAG